MDSLKDSKQQTSEIVSHSLILTPPAYYNFRDYPGFDLGVGDEWMGFCDGNEWMDLNSIDIHEWFEESPPLKKKLCLSLKNKKTSATRSFEESTKSFQSDEQSRFVLPVTRSEKFETERVVQLKKSNHCFPLKSEKPEASKVLKDSINTSHTVAICFTCIGK